MAEGLNGLVLDIKVGNGAFMKGTDDARLLADSMIDIGAAHDVDVRAFLTNMDQPLGFEVGNANEVRESIAVLAGSGPSDVTALVKAFGAAMLETAGISDGAKRIDDAVGSGAALERLEAMIEAQGGDAAVVANPDLLPGPAHKTRVMSTASGHVTVLDALAIGLAALDLGAGRRVAHEAIDPAAGVTLHAKVGDHVDAGEPIATVFSSDGSRLGSAAERVAGAYTIEVEPAPVAPLILEEVST